MFNQFCKPSVLVAFDILILQPNKLKIHHSIFSRKNCKKKPKIIIAEDYFTKHFFASFLR